MLLGVFFVAGAGLVVLSLTNPALIPRGSTTLLIVVSFFGALNLFAVSTMGEYIAKILEEVKRRPHFVRRSIIRDGEIRDAPERRGSDGAVRR